MQYREMITKIIYFFIKAIKSKMPHKLNRLGYVESVLKSILKWPFKKTKKKIGKSQENFQFWLLDFV